MKLCLPELHYHSITAHVSCITVPLTALAYALFLHTGNLLFNVAHAGLAVMTFFSFFAVISLSSKASHIEQAQEPMPMESQAAVWREESLYRP